MRATTIRAVRWATDHPVLASFGIALFIRLLVIVLLQTVVDDSLFALDDDTYSGMATQAASGDTSPWDDFTRGLYNRTFGFTGPLTLLYKIFGPNKVLGQILVAVVGAATAAGVAALATRMLSPRWGLTGGLTIAFLPSQIIWSSLLLKDPFVWATLAFLALACSYALGAARRKWIYSAVGIALLLTLLTYLRNHTLVVAAWAAAFAAIVAASPPRLPRIAAVLLVATAVPLVFGLGPGGISVVTSAGSLEARRLANAQGANTAFIEVEPTPEETQATTGVGSGGIGPDAAPPPEVAEAEEELETQREAVAALISEVAAVEEDLATAAGDGAAEAKRRKLLRLQEALREEQRLLEAEKEHLAQLVAALPTPQPPVSAPDIEPETLAPDVAHLPRGLFVMLFEPVPWGPPGSSTLQMARLESLVWYPLLLLAVVGLWASRRHLRDMTFPLLVGGGVLIVYALTEGNIGTAYRHRGEFVWVVVLLAMLGANALLEKRKARSTR